MDNLEFRMRRESIKGLNLISIADIVLLLLIFFLLTSSFVIESGIRVKLPSASSAQKDSQDRYIVTLTRDGRVFLNDKQINPANLQAKIAEIQKSQPKTTVVIRSDADVEIQDVVYAIDAARNAGIERFLISTKPSE